MHSQLQRMYRYVSWADRKSIEALRAGPMPAVAESLPLVAHVLAAEHVWLSRLEQRDPRLPVWPTLSLVDCEQLAAENEAGYRSFLETLSENQLADVRQYKNAAGQEFATPVIDILLQVFSHGGYHRGQIAKIIARHGGTPPSTDFIVFAREGN